ncbi:DUF1450 domain-containing protein [Alkalihalobacterium alkalinitrilicum]|uniref:DUF1450 domain-containing protein n=1 Tax=Alkalihalobacterium alkalinitrilicum TaxID=427920 RepID=UPI00099547BF|nr:DUF1450 domain-containing protein [Alkalihalobacterium alkalinitrilicum]
MKKIYFCKENDVSKKVLKNLKEMFPELIVKRKGCVGECKTCKRCPFSLLDGKKVIKSDTDEELYKKINKQILKKAK